MTYAAVILPHYNDTRRLARCLAALVPQRANNRDIEILVVDNASSEPLDEIAVAYPEVRIIIETRKGAANARNRGVAETTAKRLFFLDCDCVPDEDWLRTALEVAGRGDLVGGAVTVFDETPAPRSGPEAFETVFAFDNRGYIERKGFSVTANLLTNRQVFDAVGGFRHGMSEDLDWCRRAAAAGFALVYEDRLRVAHPTRSDWWALERKWRRLTDESWGLEGRGAWARVKWALKALAMPLSILPHGPRILRHDALAAGERRAALATLTRLRLVRMGWMLRQATGAQR